jgi:hypothetical protein
MPRWDQITNCAGVPEVAAGLCHLSLSAGDSKKIVPAVPLHDFVKQLED